MAEQIYIGNFPQGLTLNRTAFNIDNGAFPFLWNFYVWRGRLKRKRGTQLLGQLQAQVSFNNSMTKAPWQFQRILVSNGAANLLTAVGASSGASIVPGTIEITYNSLNYSEPSTPNGTLLVSGSASGFIDYATGNIYLSPPVSGNANATGTFSYYPGNPVMGLEDFGSIDNTFLYPALLAFDTTTAYQFNNTSMMFYNVSFYKYTNVDVIWSGQNFQQFWTTNYSGALWATNNNPGANFVRARVTSSGPGMNQVTFTLTTIGGQPFGGSVVNDFLWFNEFPSTTPINNLTGQVVTVTAPNTVVVQFSQTVSVTNADMGIAQLLTNSVTTASNGIKWYDGDPTVNQSGYPPFPPASPSITGWANFAPPLTATTVSINDTPPALYYLVGALAILPFKDRLLFFSPWIQTSTGSPIQLIDTVIWSWNGTPYYTPATITPGPPPSYTPAVTPAFGTGNYIANPSAYYVDQPGFGGFLSAGINQPIITVGSNQDVLIVNFGGSSGRKTRFVYSGNDLQPFLFFNINLELPSFSTFSSIVLDKGVIDIGNYGIALTDQQSSQRIDLDIPDNVFEIQGTNNGAQRVNSVRDFINEWIYFTYTPNNSPWVFPTQTLFFNYRENTWAIHYENFTTQGLFRSNSDFTWATCPYTSWAVWSDPWDSGTNAALAPIVIGGNPQGYVLKKDVGTGEGISGTVSAITNNNGNSQITSFNHCVSPTTLGIGDYVYFQNAILANVSSITGITTDPSFTVITANNSFYPGQQVIISAVVGVESLNEHTFTIILVSSTSFTIEADTDGESYISGGIVVPVFNEDLGFNNVVGKVISVFTSNNSNDPNNFIVDIPYPFTDQIATITGATNANPCVLIANNSFSVGQEILINGVVGMTQLNGNVYVIIAVSSTTITINVNSTSFGVYSSGGTATLLQYSGLGQFTRLSLPLFQTKQFPFYWQEGRQARLSLQKYLMSTTDNSQVTVNIYLSQDMDGVWNDPTVNVPPGTLVYSQVLFTCPESTNIGLTAANTNLQMPIASGQQQIWHRMNTSLIGDSFQIGITLSDAQMRNLDFATDEIVLHGMVLTADKGPHLA